MDKQTPVVYDPITKTRIALASFHKRPVLRLCAMVWAVLLAAVWPAHWQPIPLSNACAAGIAMR